MTATAFTREHVLFQMCINCVIAQQHDEACREIWNAQMRSSSGILSAPLSDAVRHFQDFCTGSRFVLDRHTTHYDIVSHHTMKSKHLFV